MITKLEINNFRGFRKFEISPLTRINLLGGKNNAGKTSLLESIFLFYDRFNPSMFTHLSGLRGLDKIYLRPKMIWEPTFYNFDTSLGMKIALFREGSKDSINFSPWVPDSYSITLKKGIRIETKNNTNIDNSSSLNLKYYENNKLKSESILSVDGSDIKLKPKGAALPYGREKEKQAIFLTNRVAINSQEEVTRFGDIDIKPGELNKIIKFIQIIEPRIKSLTTIVAGETSYVYAEIDGLSRKLPIKLAGDGTARLLSIILAIASVPKGVVLIDEIENGLHYSVMQEVWTAIALAVKEYDCQLFITTHSYECLKAASIGIEKANMEEEFTYARLDCIDEEIIPKIFDSELLKYALKNHAEVR